MKKNKLEIIVFVCGVFSMALELVAARIFSPYVGSSNLVWTTIIGMILIFMSFGYYVGGKVADKKQDMNILRFLLYIALVYIALLPILEMLVLEPFAKIGLPLVITGIIMSVILFFVPSFVFAFASPFIVKLKQIDSDENKEKIGEISGKMSAYSTIGSIIGTFVTGFWLIPMIGIRGIVFLITCGLEVVLIALEEKFDFKIALKYIIVTIFIIAGFCLGIFLYEVKHPEIIRDINSEYSRIQVIEYENKNKEKIKYIKVGNEGNESYINENTGRIGGYLYFFDLAKYYIKDYRNSLLIGGAAYSYPTYFYGIEENKNIKMDVVEIDETMTKIAVEEFGLNKDNPSLDIIHQDGRSYLNYTDKKYDAILVDAFKGLYVPFELTTYEAVSKMYEVLNDNGIVITNIISSFEGKDSKVLKHEYATYKAVFDDVKLFYQNENLKDELETKQNIILIGFKGDKKVNESKKECYESLLDNEIYGYTSDKDIVTDNLAQIGN